VTIRVVVCYTGGVGKQAIRLLAADPGFRIVGVLVHHAEKDGQDAGEIAGIGPIGVRATRDVDALVALRADGALWHGMTWEPQVVARFLAAGTNVYSSIGGWWLPGMPEHDEIAAACEAGGSSFVAGGNIPGLISDVLPMFVSGYTARVSKVRAHQRDHNPHYPSAAQLAWLGMGEEPGPSEASAVADAGWMWAANGSARMVAAGLGLEVTDVRLTGKEYAVTPEEMVLSPSGLEIGKGRVAGIQWTFAAFAGDHPFYELVVEQTVRLGLGPGFRQTADQANWRVEITGVPNVACEFSLPHDQDAAHDKESERMDPVAALNAARAVNFIPRLIEAAPGYRTVLDMTAPRAATLAPGLRR
jgi:4-hydroxy-tetrahydrodipicolinate reductase